MPPGIRLANGQTASPEVMSGGDLTLSVSISGFNLPLTSISWTQQGSILTGSEDRITITNSPMLPATSGPVTSTFLLSATVPRDAGRYGVTARNDAGYAFLEFTLSVPGKYRARRRS